MNLKPTGRPVVPDYRRVLLRCSILAAKIHLGLSRSCDRGPLTRLPMSQNEIHTDIRSMCFLSGKAHILNVDIRRFRRL
jgi:hypothetical protein